MKSESFRNISIAPSLRLRALVLIGHCIGGVSVLLASVSPGLTVVLLVLVGASLARLRRPKAALNLRLHADGRLEVLANDGTAEWVEVHPHTLALPFLIVLIYRRQGRLESYAALPDSLAADDFRQLTIWLRWRLREVRG
jgi:hypothetical protein